MITVKELLEQAEQYLIAEAKRSLVAELGADGGETKKFMEGMAQFAAKYKANPSTMLKKEVSAKYKGYNKLTHEDEGAFYLDDGAILVYGIVANKDGEDDEFFVYMKSNGSVTVGKYGDGDDYQKYMPDFGGVRYKYATFTKEVKAILSSAIANIKGYDLRKFIATNLPKTKKKLQFIDDSIKCKIFASGDCEVSADIKGTKQFYVHFTLDKSGKISGGVRDVYAKAYVTDIEKVLH